MNKKNVAFMAFASGSESVDSVRKLYIGVAPVHIVTVNPTKAEYEKLFNKTLEDAIVYVSETEVGPEGNKRKVPQIRIDFIVETDAEKCGIQLRDRVSFFLTRAIEFNKTDTKVRVINKYGESTYLPKECLKGEPLPDNMQWYDTSGMREAYIGEADLTDFLKAFLNIPNKSYKNKKGEVVFIKNIADAEARLDKIENYFKGDVSELKSLVKLQPNNVVKIMFGVRTTDDNKQYQAVYTKKFLKNMVNDYSKLDEDLQSRKNAGAYPTTEFNATPISEYVVESTNFAPQSNPQNDPLGANTTSGWTPWNAQQ